MVAAVSTATTPELAEYAVVTPGTIWNQIRDLAVVSTKHYMNVRRNFDHMTA